MKIYKKKSFIFAITFIIIIIFGYFFLKDCVMISESKNSNPISMSVDDIIGYVSIESIDLVTPLMQGLDNTFYFSHNYLRNNDDYGEIFLDYEGDLNYLNNAVIYTKINNLNYHNLRINDIIEINYLKNIYCFRIDKITKEQNNSYDLVVKVFENADIINIYSNIIKCKNT